MELAEQRRRELQLRSRSKEELSAMQFERDKYHSFLEQAKRALEEHAKRIGKTCIIQDGWKTRMRN